MDPSGFQLVGPPPTPLASGAITAEGGGEAVGIGVGCDLAGPCAAAAMGGWFLGRWIDSHAGISVWLGNQFGGYKDSLPADPRFARHVVRNGKGFHKGRGDDPLYDLPTDELQRLLRDPTTPAQVKKKINQVLKFRKQRNKKRRE